VNGSSFASTGETADEHSRPRVQRRSAPEPPDFSLVLGGPLFQLLRRAHLSDDALMLVRQRILVIALLAWLPLLVLSPWRDSPERPGGTLSAGHGGSHPLPGGLAPVDRCRAGRTPAHAPAAAAIPGTTIDPRGRDGAVRVRPSPRRSGCVTRSWPRCCSSPLCMGSGS